MPLSDLKPLEAFDASLCDRLRKRLVEVGLTIPNLEPVVRSASSTHPIMRKPVLRYYLRKSGEPFTFAARALMFSDPVTRAELDSAFGDLVAPLLQTGLLLEHEHGFQCPFLMTVVSGLYLLTDDLSQGGDAVMGLGPTTNALGAAALPRQRIGRAVDIGCGAGTIGLVLSRRAEHVIGTDINDRALTISRFNARLNGITNIEFRNGSLYEPVAGEKLDLVVSQPPFVPEVDDGKTGGSFMHGGRRGDELVVELLKATPQHLSPHGRAVIFAEWGYGAKQKDAPERIKEALGPAKLDTLVFQFPATSADTHAIEYAAALHPELGPAFEADATFRREHLARVGFEVMVPTIIVLQGVAGRSPRFDVLPAAPLPRLQANSRRIDKLLAAREISSTPEKLLSAKLRMVQGVALREEQQGPGANVESMLYAVMPPSAMTEPIRMTPLLLRVATCIHEADSVKAGVETYRKSYDPDESPGEIVNTVLHALLAGLLEVAD